MLGYFLFTESKVLQCQIYHMEHLDIFIYHLYIFVRCLLRTLALLALPSLLCVFIWILAIHQCILEWPLKPPYCLKLPSVLTGMNHYTWFWSVSLQVVFIYLVDLFNNPLPICVLQIFSTSLLILIIVFYKSKDL